MYTEPTKKSSANPEPTSDSAQGARQDLASGALKTSMQGSTDGNVGRPKSANLLGGLSGWALLLWSCAVLLLFLGIAINANRQLSTSRYAATEQIDLPKTSATLYVQYPTVLELDTPGQEGRQIVAWITEANSVHAGRTYTVTFTHGEPLLLGDKNGKVVSSRVVLTAGEGAEYPVVLPLRAAPLLSPTLPVSTTVGVIVRDSRGRSVVIKSAAMAIRLETETELLWRAGLLRVFGDNALILGLVLAAGGWAFEYEKRRSDRSELAAKERKAELEAQKQVEHGKRLQSQRGELRSLRYQIDRSPEKTLQQCLQLHAQQQKEPWDAPHDIELKLILNEVAQEKYLARVFAGASSAIEKGSPITACSVIKQVAQFEKIVPNEMSQIADQIAPLLEEKLFTDPPQSRNGLAAVSRLCLKVEQIGAPELTVDALVAQVCRSLTDLPHGTELLKQGLADSREFRVTLLPILSRDWQLGPIVADLDSFRYRWPTATMIDSQDSELRSQWFERQGLYCNPFGAGNSKVGTLLTHTWVDPVGWQDVNAFRPTLVLTENEADCQNCAAYLCHVEHWQSPDRPFVVRAELALSDGVMALDRRGLLRVFARAFGKAWRQLLISDDTFWTRLAREEQMIVSELLLWTAGSRTYLNRWFRDGRSFHDDQASIAVLQKVNARLGTQQRIENPSSTAIDLWLALRPEGVEQTYLVVTCEAPQDIRCTSQIPLALRLADELSANHIALKLFTIEPAAPNPGFVPVARLKWAKDAMVKMLSDRMVAVSKAALPKFGGLFSGLDNPDFYAEADDILATGAEGALALMLRIGIVTIDVGLRRMQAEGVNAEYKLIPADLAAAIEEVHSQP